MNVKGLVPPQNLDITFKPSPKQYELWKMLQPDYCPECGGHIHQAVIGKDMNGNNVYKPECESCGNRNLPQLILGGGAAGGGKSFVGSCWIISSCIRFPGLRAMIARKTIKSLKESTFNTVRSILRQWGLVENENFKINNLDNYLQFWNGSVILLRELETRVSDAQFERLGSTELSIAFVDEVSEISEKAIEVLFSRLRWMTHETFKVPKLLMTTNPCATWVRSRFVQDDNGDPVTCKEGEFFCRFSVYDNPDENFKATYVAGLQRITDEAVKARLLYGNWDYVEQNKSAAYWNFNGDKHLKDGLKENVYNPLTPLILSFDFNVAPYMSCLAIQVDYENKCFNVLEEITGLPDNKENNTPAFASKIARKYLENKHLGGLIITGDPAGLARSTTTKDGVNNYTIIEGKLSAFRTTRMVANTQPPQAPRLEFINSVFADKTPWKVVVDMRCRRLTEDFIYQKRNSDGTKEKKRVTDPKSGVKYEKYGHLSDCFDYAMCMFLKNDWHKFQHPGGTGRITTISGIPVYGDFEY